MSLTTEIVLKKIKEISSRHLMPDPSLRIDSLALMLGVSIEALKPHLDTLISFGDIIFIQHDKASNQAGIGAGSVRLVV